LNLFAVLARKLRVARSLMVRGIGVLRTEGLAAAARYARGILPGWLRERRRSATPAPPNAIDWEHGTDTSSNVRLHHLDITSPNYRYAVYYHPSRVRVLREILERLPVRHEDYTFIDFGSGKGLVLLQAAAYPFRRVIGVEFARELHEIARRNLDKYPQSLRKTDVQLVHGDALEFEPPPGNLVLYLFEPFEAPLARQFLRRAERFAADRDVIVAYVWSVNPSLNCKALWDAAPFLKEAATGDGWIIYRRREPLRPGAEVPPYLPEPRPPLRRL
jgi:SAM-dependent methyltransferase